MTMSYAQAKIVAENLIFLTGSPVDNLVFFLMSHAATNQPNTKVHTSGIVHLASLQQVVCMSFAASTLTCMLNLSALAYKCTLINMPQAYANKSSCLNT